MAKANHPSPGPEAGCCLEEIFRAEGPLARLIPQYSFRQEQVAMARLIQQSLEESAHSLAEAGTGTGKSLAYLVPAISWSLRHKQRIVVATHTKALQSQLIEKELPRLASAGIFPRPFQHALCLGAENYLCLFRLLEHASQEALPGIEPGAVESLRSLLAWCREAVSGIRANHPLPVPDVLWSRVCVIKDLCLGRNCQYYEECYWQQAKARQWEADLLVTNHSQFFSHLATGGRVLPEFTAAVLDEAHKLEDVATQFLGDEINWLQVQHLFRELSARGRGSLWAFYRQKLPSQVEEVQIQVEVVRQQQNTWWHKLAERMPRIAEGARCRPQDVPPADEAALGISRLLTLLKPLEAAAETEIALKSLQYLSQRLAVMARVQQAWAGQSQPEAVYWLERIQPGPGPLFRAMITPLDLSSRLRTLVFESISSVCLTSATLAINGDFKYCRASLGVPPEAREIIVPSPFDYRASTRCYLPKAIPDPRQSEDFTAGALAECTALIRMFSGGVFVLCTSYQFLRQAARHIREAFPEREVLVQGEEASPALLARFQNSCQAVLIGVETFWQGVDVPGDALQCVVITRLPFDVPTHPVHQARMKYRTSQGENAFQTYAIPRAVLMLKQGFGRLIRRHEDWGAVAILDPRVQTRAWGERFLEALPPCPRIRGRHALQDFILNHVQVEDL